MHGLIRQVVISAVLLLAGGPAMAPAAAACPPTPADALGPFYRPDAPVRTAVGRGHVLWGVVRSARGCLPLGGARIEIWLAGPAGTTATPGGPQ